MTEWCAGRSLGVVAGAALTLLVIGLTRCGGGKASPGAPEAGDTDGAADAQDAAQPFAGVPGCDAGWWCKVDPGCSTPTTLTGKVYDPAARTPLANVVLYVPKDLTLEPAITAGSPTCTPLTISDYVSVAVTNNDGTFKMQNVPTGKGVPVTVQMGKWRRTVLLDIADDCDINAVTDGVLRLPRSHTEGDMPQMALLTGGEDDFACLLLGMGVDANEFGPPGSGGRVDVYRGVGGADLSTPSRGAAADCTGASCPLWDTAAHLAAYDAILLGCEGGPHLETKPAASMQAMDDWLAVGGKLFGVHSQDVWLSQGPADLAGVATWVDGGASGAPGPFRINTSFVSGAIFEQWASGLGVADADGGLPLVPADVATSVAAVTQWAVGWVLDESTASPDGGGASIKALSVAVPLSTPVPHQECGRAMLTDIHPGGRSAVSAVPSGCPQSDWSSEDRVLEYLFFRALEPFPQVCTSGCGPPFPLPPPPLDGGDGGDE